MLEHNPEKALTDESFWGKTWGQNARKVKFSPYKLSFLYFHRIFRRLLPAKPCTFFEVGCFPGHFLWYFSKYFGYDVAGIEYMPQKGDAVRQQCLLEGVDAKIINDDFFRYKPLQRYDIVGSFGFIEHFENSAAVVRKHFEITRPGGLIVITAPNHASPLYKKLLRLSGEELYHAHNQMSLQDLIGCFKRNSALTIVGAGYCGHFGIGYTGTMSALRNQPHIVRILVRGAAYVGELVSQLLPDNAILSQAMYVIARRHETKD